MSILNKVGPLGEKVGRSLFGNVGGAVKGISNIGGGIDGDLISQTLGGQETGSSAGLSYPLDVVGNPAYPATVRFKVMRYGSPTETSQKEMDKTIEDNKKKALQAALESEDDEAAFIAETNPDAITQIATTNVEVDTINNRISQIAGSVTETNLAKSVSNTIKSGMRFLEERNQPVVLLYFPMSMQFSDGAQYDRADLGATGAIGEAALQSGLGVTGAALENIRSGVSSISDVLSANPRLGEEALTFSTQRVNELFGRLLGRGNQNAISLQTRMIINPNVRSIFRGVALREFSFQFKFIANSSEEARVVQQIIKHFRSQLYPDIFGVTVGDQQAAVGFKFPNAFKISFQFRGIDSSKIPKIKPAYLRNVTHTINPTGGSFRTDGQPNEIDLTMSFVEHETITSKDVSERGF
tara:strand:- start:948 stop:2180 length:1233 start_codon:yes stop_codon:yes gene_type:complete